MYWKLPTDNTTPPLEIGSRVVGAGIFSGSIQGVTIKNAVIKIDVKVVRNYLFSDQASDVKQDALLDVLQQK